jgi:hypothetical protein
MKRAVYVCNLPLTAQRARELFVDELLRIKAPVEYWDISGIQFQRDVHLSGEIDPGIIVKMDSKREVRKRIAEYSGRSTVFITYMTFSWRTLWLFRLYRRYACSSVYIERGGIPSPRPGKSLRFLGAGRFGEIWRAILDKAAWYLMRLGLVKGYDTVVTAGSELATRFQGMCRIIECNHFDYDNYLELQKAPGQSRERFAVFLGQNHGMHHKAGHHSDPTLLGMEPINPETYQQGLSRFFNLVEERFGVRVVIAAHPKSDYCDGVFNDREMVKNRTNELVRDCDFVLGHASTALSFAVLFHKPVVLLYNNEQKRLEEIYSQIQVFSEALGTPLYNVDEIHRAEQIAPLSVDQERYVRYKYRYLTSPGTERAVSKDIFLDFLSE